MVFPSAPSGRCLGIDPERQDLVELLGAHAGGGNEGGGAFDFRATKGPNPEIFTRKTHS
jgi:hypothetical protein